MQLLLEVIPSRPNLDLRVFWPLITAQSRIPSSQHFVRNTVDRQGWLGVGAVSAAVPLHLPVGPEAWSSGSGQQ